MSPARVTLSAINRRLASLGVEAEIVRGRAYFYFVGGDVPGGSFSVYTYHLRGWTIDQWCHYLAEHMIAGDYSADSDRRAEKGRAMLAALTAHEVHA